MSSDDKSTEAKNGLPNDIESTADLIRRIIEAAPALQKSLKKRARKGKMAEGGTGAREGDDSGHQMAKIIHRRDYQNRYYQGLKANKFDGLYEAANRTAGTLNKRGYPTGRAAAFWSPSVAYRALPEWVPKDRCVLCGADEVHGFAPMELGEGETWVYPVCRMHWNMVLKTPEVTIVDLVRQAETIRSGYADFRATEKKCKD